MTSQLKQSTRNRVLEAYDHECIFCGMAEEKHQDQHGRSLDVHHLVPSSAGGSDDVDNLVPLCRDCHNTMEATQGKAMKEIAEQKEISADPDELKRLEKENNKMDKEIIGLLNIFQDFLLEGYTVNVHVVVDSEVPRPELLYVGTDEEAALECYKEGGSYCRLYSDKIHDVSIIENMSYLDWATLFKSEETQTFADDLLPHVPRSEAEEIIAELNEKFSDDELPTLREQNEYFGGDQE